MSVRRSAWRRWFESCRVEGPREKGVNRRAGPRRACSARGRNGRPDDRMQRPPVEGILFEDHRIGPLRAVGNPVAQSLNFQPRQGLAVLGHLRFFARDHVDQPALVRLARHDDGIAFGPSGQPLGGGQIEASFWLVPLVAADTVTPQDGGYAVSKGPIVGMDCGRKGQADRNREKSPRHAASPTV